MKKPTGFHPRLRVDAAGSGLVSQAGGALLVETVRAVALDRLLSAALAPWRKPGAVHDPAKVVVDLAVALALGGDCLADIAVLREQPGVFGRVASDPTVSRTIDSLAANATTALAAINTARSQARALAWRAAGVNAPDDDRDAARSLVIDVDATLVTAHSEKEPASPTFKRGFGFHPLWAFVDHGGEGTGEPVAVMLRPGRAGSKTATDHITVLRQALAQLPGRRAGRRVLVRIDGAGATHELLTWLDRRRLSYSIGFSLPESFAATLPRIPARAWTPAYTCGQPGLRPGMGALLVLIGPNWHRQVVEVRHQTLGADVGRLAELLTDLVSACARGVPSPSSCPQAPVTSSARGTPRPSRRNAATPVGWRARASSPLRHGGPQKTALAVHWGHLAKHTFPDGQLYVDLRGFGAEQPMAPAEALSILMRSLGVSQPDEFVDIDESPHSSARS